MNIEQLYRDYNIPYVTEGHKHSRRGWVNIACPFCVGNPGFHLGYNTSLNRFTCYRCGGKPASYVISTLLSIGKKESNTLLQLYGVNVRNTSENKPQVRLKAFKLPSYSEKLQKQHIKYLVKRGFDPEEIESIWGILGTGPLSDLGGINYKHRIIIPFTWEDRIVSFDSRDITNRHNNKYQACPADREEIPHKDILYGKPDKWEGTGICVEGPTDVWRLGELSMATSGIKYTPKQLRFMAKRFKRIAVAFDDEPQAVKQANKLVGDLKFRGVDAFRVPIVGDPGGMSQSEADYLVKQLITK